eukprot:scaffold15190_cov61-Phaeocystis_antarctica.AAC.4
MTTDMSTAYGAPCVCGCVRVAFVPVCVSFTPRCLCLPRPASSGPPCLPSPPAQRVYFMKSLVSVWPWFCVPRVVNKTETRANFLVCRLAGLVVKLRSPDVPRSHPPTCERERFAATTNSGTRSMATQNLGTMSSSVLQDYHTKRRTSGIELAAIDAALAQLKDSGSRTNWLLACYDPGNKHRLLLLRTGEGGFEELLGSLDDACVLYGCFVFSAANQIKRAPATPPRPRRATPRHAAPRHATPAPWCARLSPGPSPSPNPYPRQVRLRELGRT